MKKAVVGFFALGISLLGHLSFAEAQECGYFFENGTSVGTGNVVTVFSSIKETTPQNTNILTLKFKPETAEIVCETDSAYLGYNINKPILEMITNGTLNKDFDEGLLIDNLPVGNCRLSCSSDPTIPPKILVNQVQVTSVNDLIPQFSEPKLNVMIDETTSPEVDILSRSDKLLYAFDMDYDENGKDAQIVFSVDNDKFVVLPSFQISYNSKNNVERIYFIPRVGLAAAWNRQDGTSVTFNLIAKDQGKPQNEKFIPVTVQIEQVDMENPQFLKNYYTAVIDSSLQVGDVLSVEPESIRAFDPDTSSSDEILYEIVDYDSLDLVLIANENGGVDVQLNAQVIPSQKKMAYVVIQASEINNKDRFGRVVLAIELPLEVAPTTTGTPETCPPCTTTTTCPPCTLPTVTCPTSTSCDYTTISSTSCPESSICDCTTALSLGNSTTSTAPSNPSDTSTTQATTVTLYTKGTASNLPTETSASTLGTCPPCPTCTSSEASDTSPWSSTTQPISTTIPESTTPESCPVVTCPTCTSCPPCASCPPEIPCPSSTVASCPPCDISPSTSAVIASVLCLLAHRADEANCTTEQPRTTTASSSPRPTVNFEKDQYASEIIENSAVGTPVGIVHAFSSDGNMNIVYSLKSGDDSRYFKIDEKSGDITLSYSLQKGSYSFHAEASLSTGERGITIVRVEAVQGYVIGEMHFASSHYKFHINEKSAKGSPVGVVELRNPSDSVDPRITSVDPENMNGYFYLETKETGSVLSIEIFVNATFNRINSGPRVMLGISASLTRSVELSTLVDIAVDDVNEAPSFTTSESLVIGYPGRTYFDQAVSMPIYTFQASDPDEGVNAVLSYHLIDDSRKDFDIDANNGQLFAINLDSLSLTDRSLTVTVTDLPGNTSSLQVKIRSLRNDEIHVITATGPEILSDEDISKSLSTALGYEVVVLHKAKTERSAGKTKANTFDYRVSVYAVRQGNFVDRTKFEKDLQTNAGNITGWTVSATVEQLEAYTPDKLSNRAEAYTVATAVLASILGLILLSTAGYLVFLFRKGKQMPWERLHSSRKGNKEVNEKENDLENTYKRASDSTDSHSSYPNPASFMEGSKGYSEYMPPAPTGAPGPIQNDRVLLSVIDPKEIYNPNAPKPENSALKSGDTEEEVYCPPSPTPKKSILKDVQYGKDVDKVPERTGVSFDPTPEVIQVAPTLPEEEDEKADSSSDDSEDGAVAIL